MCVTITEYSCSHRVPSTKPCLEYRKQHEQYRKAKRSQGLFSCFLSTSLKEPRCRALPSRKAVYGRVCEACARSILQGEREKQRREERTREEWNLNTKQQQQQIAQEPSRPEMTVKETWRCEQCVQERRTPSRRIRAANGGCCCARGLEEVTNMRQERENGKRYAKGKGKGNRHPQRPAEPQSYTHYQRPGAPRPAHIPRKKERTAELQYVTSTEFIRGAATRAADQYGWSRLQKRDSEFLEPELVEAYVNLPGADPAVIGQGPHVPVGHFVQPPIDWERWNRMHQGNHGRFPSDMPQGATPITPLNIRKAGNAGPSQISRKPVPCRKWSSSEELPVSPHESPSRPLSPYSPLSPASRSKHPGQEVRKEMENLNHQIGDLMNGWNADAPPSPQSWRQHQDWHEIRY
ncbi:hypothetical protein LZ554_007879 [Drepanopeziza brunnea f. sp. 'monogermtubi']|nr:hypothetical protein LZ554_007879 [Drepanopeziza brunnea f. sp. 'monogermtubi']